MSARDSHLGDLAAALVDDALDGRWRDRALAHIAGCTDCRAEVDQQRQFKELMRRRTEPTLSSGLAERLRAIGDPPPADASGAATALSRDARTTPLAMPKPRNPVPVAGRRPRGTPRPSAAPTRPARRARRARRVTGGVTALALGVAVALTFGPLRDEGPAVSPPVGRYAVEHARTTGGVPGVDPGAGAVMTVSANR